MTRLQPLETIADIRNAMDCDISFTNEVYSYIDEDKVYWHDRIEEDYIEASQIQGYHLLGGKVIIDDFKLFVETCDSSNFLPCTAKGYFTDLWDAYQHGWRSTSDLLHSINLAIGQIEGDYKAVSEREMLTDDEFFEHGIESDYYLNFYFDNETNEVVRIEEEYSKDLDMTFIFKIKKTKAGWDESVRDIVNYYCGEPSTECLQTYYR